MNIKEIETSKKYKAQLENIKELMKKNDINLESNYCKLTYKNVCDLGDKDSTALHYIRAIIRTIETIEKYYKDIEEGKDVLSLPVFVDSEFVGSRVDVDVANNKDVAKTTLTISWGGPNIYMICDYSSGDKLYFDCYWGCNLRFGVGYERSETLKKFCKDLEDLAIECHG